MKYYIPDCEFNRENYPDAIGKVFDNPPSYAKVYQTLTLEEAKNLYIGQIVYHVKNKNADGSPQRWKVNGKVKTWKTMPERVKVPVKYGLYTFDYITEDNLDLVFAID